MPPVFPPVVLWSVGVLGAIALVRLIRREHKRINDELERARATPVASKTERARHPTLRRDPRTGIYHP